MVSEETPSMSAYTQFGYSYPSASQLMMTGQPTTSPPAPATSCCENGRPIATDPVSGQTICSCQYDPTRLAALGSYTRLSSGLGSSVYGAAYPSTEQNPYPSIGVDSTAALYPTLGTPYGLKDPTATADVPAWTHAGLQTSAGYYPYDPTFAAYGYGAGYDLAARRKNATRESTATLKAWLSEHKKNPYPTKGEKIMLAIITKMTLTQVSTWFANARRRLKKENKMTWEPKNKTDDDDASNDDDKEKKLDDLDDIGIDRDEKCSDDEDNKEDLKLEPATIKLEDPSPLSGLPHSTDLSMSKPLEKPNTDHCGVPVPPSKPKIWSLADTATCKTPPPVGAVPKWMNGVNSHFSPYSRYPGLLTTSITTSSSSSSSSSSLAAGGGYVEGETPPQTPPGVKLGYGNTFLGGGYRLLGHPRSTGYQESSSNTTAFRPIYKSSPPGSSYLSPV